MIFSCLQVFNAAAGFSGCCRRFSIAISVNGSTAGAGFSAGIGQYNTQVPVDAVWTHPAKNDLQGTPGAEPGL